MQYHFSNCLHIHGMGEPYPVIMAAKDSLWLDSVSLYTSVLYDCFLFFALDIYDYEYAKHIQSIIKPVWYLRNK